ncbi:MAG: hypothetical protein PHS05_02170 [Bacteroidales bacterium]|nr:hypothetical protein [Bacteroidales bacterium]
MRLNFLTLRRLFRLDKNNVLIEQLAGLAVPYNIRIGLREYPVPLTVNDLGDNICWGQRLLMATEHKSDLETYMFFLANYYQPVVTGKPFSEKRVMKFYKKITKCHAVEAYPVLTRLVNLFTEMVKIENEKLNRPPTKAMQAAEIDKLQPFSDLNILELIADKCKVKLTDAHMEEYNVVFALLWSEKESQDFQERYSQIQIAQNK